MTEAKWLDRNGHSQWMMLFLQEQRVARTKAGRRKLRLFACGCCRVVWGALPDDRLREAVEVAERFADGLATKAELAAARRAVEGMGGVTGPFGDRTPDVWVAIFMAESATDPQAFSTAFLMTATGMPLAGCVPADAAESHLRDLVRCVFGNPFRPVIFDPDWRTPSAVALVRTMYESRDFAHMTILADALEDAGCDQPDIIAHCRGPGPHVRGCWVVDLVLGKE